MDAHAISQNWALFAAVLPAAIVVLLVWSALYRRSASGLLNTVLRDHKGALAEARKAGKNVVKLSARVAKLEQNADKVKPRVLEETKGLLSDALAFEKIAADKVLVTANHVRRVIHEEFPPSMQDKLRSRYLPEDGPDGRPFSFNS